MHLEVMDGLTTLLEVLPMIPPTFLCPSTLPVFMQSVRDKKPLGEKAAIPPADHAKLFPVGFVAVMLPVFMQEMMCPSFMDAIPPTLSSLVILPVFMQLDVNILL